MTDFLLGPLRHYVVPEGVTPHDKRCCQRAFPHTDAAKRVSDAVNLHYAAMGFDSAKKWIACRLEDGRGGTTLYDRKRDAVRAQSDEFLCLYICLTGTPMNPCEAEILLRVNRQAYENGFRMTDPDSSTGGPEIIPRTALEHRLEVVKRLGGGKYRT